MNTPQDMYEYVVRSQRESDFLSAILLQTQNYSIAEITDARFGIENGTCRLKSQMYHLNVNVDDDNIYTAVSNGLYVTAFLSRHNDAYQVHFLMHNCPVSMKPRFEEEIAKEVVRYMILKTIVALRLNTQRKVNDYLG